MRRKRTGLKAVTSPVNGAGWVSGPRVPRTKALGYGKERRAALELGGNVAAMRQRSEHSERSSRTRARSPASPKIAEQSEKEFADAGEIGWFGI